MQQITKQITFSILFTLQVTASFAQQSTSGNSLLNNKSYNSFKTEPSFYTNRKTELMDIQNKNIKLYLPDADGGSPALCTDETFKKKYDLKLTGWYASNPKRIIIRNTIRLFLRISTKGMVNNGEKR